MKKTFLIALLAIFATLFVAEPAHAVGGMEGVYEQTKSAASNALSGAKNIVSSQLNSMAGSSNDASSASKLLQIISGVSMVVAIAHFMGMLLFLMALWNFKRNAENPNAFPLAQTFSMLIAGTMLLSLGQIYNITVASMAPELVGAKMNILAVNAHISGLEGKLNTTGFAAFIPASTGKAILAFVYFIGLIAFVRGIFMIKNIGQAQMASGSPGGFGAAATHILGGAAAMNITQFSCYIGSFLGTDKICLTANAIGG